MVDIVVVGCGCPKRSMGWVHARNVFEGRVAGDEWDCRLRVLVEPFLLSDAGRGSPAGTQFKEWAKTLPSTVQVVDSLDDPALDVKETEGRKVMAMIATRTADVPEYFEKLIALGVKYFYVEKPGADSVEKLKNMDELAAKAGARVAVGYARNMSKYMLEGYEDVRKAEGANVTFIHNNSYNDDTLDECFARNSEGILKNMACHELCQAVKYFGLSVADIKDVTYDSSMTKLEKRCGHDDFSRVCFTVAMTSATHIRFEIDRCGGDWVGLRVGEKLLALPSEQEKAVFAAKAKADPEMQPYFIVQEKEYVDLLSSVCDTVVKEKEWPAPIATLADATEVLKIADHVTDILKMKLAACGA